MKKAKRIFILLISLVLLCSALPVASAATGPDNGTVDKLIDASMDWLLLTHIYTDGDVMYRSYPHGTIDTLLKDHVNPDKSFVKIYGKSNFIYRDNAEFLYRKVTYHDWHSFNDMYAEAGNIFSGDWIKRSVHSIFQQEKYAPDNYEHFIEKDGDIYVCAGIDNSAELLGYLFFRTLEARYTLLGEDEMEYLSEDGMKDMSRFFSTGWVNKRGFGIAVGAKVYDRYIYKITAADSTEAKVDVVVFNALAARNSAFKATLELKNTQDGWRISGGTLIEAFYEGKILDKMSEDEYVAFLADIGVDDINPPLAAPPTGDTSGTRVVIFTSVAALAAVIPAAVLTFRRRRED